MIPMGYTKPKHARTQYDALAERRDYPDNVCPGRRCAGRLRLHQHQNGMALVHYLSPEQIAKGRERAERERRNAVRAARGYPR